jgi:cytochrome c-type biogenesis protein CcmH
MSLMLPGSALLLRLRPSSWKLVVPATIFLVVAGIGAVAAYLEESPEAALARDTSSLADAGTDGEIARLTDYSRSIGTAAPASTGAGGRPLPDVETMIEQLAARLETTPDDIDGWRMLGWSYFHTGRHEEAAAAYGRAVKLDPSSSELKLLYDQAKAKASEGDDRKTASSLQGDAVGKDGDRPSVEPEAMAPRERDAAIRSMVDGLADRLERSPRDVEGWTRLMRSRVVLGEREVAATAFRKALEVFKDDSAASSKVTAAAIELGLRDE